MDAFQERSVNNLKTRHAAQMRRIAERIQQHIGFVLKRLDEGQPVSVGHYAKGIEADAHELVMRAYALETADDVLGIMNTSG